MCWLGIWWGGGLGGEFADSFEILGGFLLGENGGRGWRRGNFCRGRGEWVGMGEMG